MSHIRKLLPLLLLCLGTLAQPVQALQVRRDAIPNKAIFGIEFSENTRGYYAREASVQSVSIHEYVTGAFHVLEVNVVTDGAALLRIYHSRPLKAGEVTDAAAGAARATGAPGSSLIRSPLPASVGNMLDRSVGQVADSLTEATVIKEYPIATHSRTIEYRLRSRNELIELYDELSKHLIREPAFYEDGRITSGGGTQSEESPRSLGGSLFIVEQ